MLHKIFVVFDSKVEAYLQPFFMRNAGEAIRFITELANDSKHNFCKHSADYTLFEVGLFDDSNAKFVLHDAKHSLGCFLEFKKDVVSGVMAKS